MTFELHQMFCIIVGLALSPSLVRGEDQHATIAHVDRIRRSPWPTSSSNDYINQGTNSINQLDNLGIFSDIPEGRRFWTSRLGHNFSGKRADENDNHSSIPFLGLTTHQLLYKPIEVRAAPYSFHERLTERGRGFGIRDLSSPLFDKIVYLGNGDTVLDFLNGPQVSHKLIGKQRRSGISSSNLWKRIPFQMFARRAPHYTHSFVGKRSANLDSSPAFHDVSQITSNSHIITGKRSTPDRLSHAQNASFAPSPGSLAPSSKVQGRYSFETRSAHSVSKRAAETDRTVEPFGQGLTEESEDYPSEKLTTDRSVELGPSVAFSEFSETASPYFDQDNFDQDNFDQDNFDPEVEGVDQTKSILGEISSNFVESSPGPKLVGKRPQFGHSFVGKRLQFGHSFVGKRLQFGHSFVGKRLQFGHSFVGKRPQFGHSFVGKRPQFGHSFIGKRPKFGHSFIGKRPKFGHSFIGKRLQFGHSFVGKRPQFGHSFPGKRQIFGTTFVEKRPQFGHTFVGKRS